MALDVNAKLSRTLIYPGHDQMMIYLLIEVKKGQVSQKAVAVVPKRQLKFVIDRSGSMSDPAGPNTRESKLGVIKDALTKYIPELDDKDEVSVDVFDDVHNRQLLTVAAGQDRKSVLKAIQNIQTGGSTKMSDALAQGILARDPKVFKKGIVIGDGLLNAGGSHENQRCVDIMGNKNSAIPAVIIGIGADYNEPLFMQMAKEGQQGTYFRHVTNATELYDVLREEFDVFKSVTGDVSDLSINIGARNGAKVVTATVFVPDQEEVAIASGPIDWNVSYDQAVIDSRGQKVLIGLEVPALTMFKNAGSVDTTVGIVEVEISYKEFGNSVAALQQTLQLEISGDKTRVQAQPSDPAVMQTMFTRQMTIHTMAGDYAGAATMASKAGLQTAQVQLEQIAAGDADENAARAARTMTRLAGMQTMLDDLSS